MPVTLNGRLFHKGDKVTFNSKAIGVCYGPVGHKVEIRYISSDTIGLYSEVRLDNWSDLDGEVQERKGWWIPVSDLEKVIEEGSNSRFEICKPIKYRGVQLEGKTCRRLVSLEDGNIFVEFDEHVNGCSADGLGKTGYCVAVSRAALKAVKKEEKQAK